MSSKIIVEFKNVSKTYHLGRVAIEALHHISFRVEANNFTFILGKSGSGKSTLLNLIGAIDMPTDGQVFINSIDISELNDNELSDFRAKNIGHIFQNFNLLPVLNVYENIEYPLLLLNKPKDKIHTLVSKIIKDVGLDGLEHHLPSELSGGQRQRIAIARALVKRPALILADEPTANLDSITSAEIISLMMKMKEEYKTTFIFVTHDKEILHSADKIFILKDGQLEEQNEQ